MHAYVPKKLSKSKCAATEPAGGTKALEPGSVASGFIFANHVPSHAGRQASIMALAAQRVPQLLRPPKHDFKREIFL